MHSSRVNVVGLSGVASALSSTKRCSVRGDRRSGPATSLDAEPDVGLLLPCNVVVRQDVTGLVTVAFIDPQTMVALTDNPQIREVADDASARLRRARERLERGDEKHSPA